MTPRIDLADKLGGNPQQPEAPAVEADIAFGATEGVFDVVGKRADEVLKNNENSIGCDILVSDKLETKKGRHVPGELDQQGKGSFRRRVGRPRSKVPTLEVGKIAEEIRRVEEDVKPLREQVEAAVRFLREKMVVPVQAILVSLAGQTAETPENNRAITDMVNDLVRQDGIELTVNDTPVMVRWHAGIFEARSLGPSPVALYRGVGYPHLVARLPPPKNHEEPPSVIAQETHTSSRGSQNSR